MAKSPLPVLSTSANSPRYAANLLECKELQADERGAIPFTWMIQGFSALLNQAAPVRARALGSGSFKACGFTWHLNLQLQKSPQEDGEEFVSLSLMHENDISSSTPSVVKAIYKLIMYDQLYMKDMEKEGEDYFYSTSRNGSFYDVPLKKFSNPKSGLLVNDSCVFRVEILKTFTCKLEREAVSECLSLRTNAAPVTQAWMIKDFSKLKTDEYSESFSAGGYSWSIVLSPNTDSATGNLPIFLKLDDGQAALTPKNKIHVLFDICMLDQVNGKHFKRTICNQFSAELNGWGWNDFIARKEVQDPTRGFLRNDTCIIEASVAVLGEVELFAEPQ